MKSILGNKIFLFCFLLGNGFIHAQNIWTSERDTTVIGLEYLRPSFKTIIDPKVTVQVFTLSGRFELRNGNIFKFELPYSILNREGYTYYYSDPYYSYSFSYSTPEVHSKTMGNLYVGIELCKEGKNTSVDLGVRLPLVSEKEPAWATAIISDVDRYEAFTPNLIAVSAIVNYPVKVQEGFAARVHFGPTFWINTNSEQGDNKFELLFGYSVQGGYHSEKFDCMAGYSGRFIATGNGNLSDRMFHQLGIFTLVRFGIIHPGFYYRIPLDDHLQIILNGVFGLSLGVTL
jgi:hypothetical protein